MNLIQIKTAEILKTKKLTIEEAAQELGFSYNHVRSAFAFLSKHKHIKRVGSKIPKNGTSTKGVYRHVDYANPVEQRKKYPVQTWFSPLEWVSA